MQIWVIVKTRCFYSLQSIQNQNFKIKTKTIKKFSTLFLRRTKKNSFRNLATFHGGLFEFEILEIFATTFLLKTIIWTWIFFKYCRVLFLKRKKNLKKDASHLKIAWYSKRLKKKIEKRERKTKHGKSQTKTINIFYAYCFIWKNLYLLKNIFGKT